MHSSEETRQILALATSRSGNPARAREWYLSEPVPDFLAEPQPSYWRKVNFGTCATTSTLWMPASMLRTTITPKDDNIPRCSS